MSLVWQSDLAPSLKLVALALADQADPDGWCSPSSMPEVADHTGYSLQRVEEIISSLMQIGYLVVDVAGSPDPSATWRLQPERWIRVRDGVAR